MRRLLFLPMLLLVFWSTDGRAYVLDPATGNLTLDVVVRGPFADPSGVAEITQTMARTRGLICDATDGQVKLTKVNVFVDDPASKIPRDVWLFSQPGRSFVRGGFPAPIYLFGGSFSAGLTASWDGETLAHELGHYMFHMGESYSEQQRFAGACGIGPGFGTENVGKAGFDAHSWNSIMDNAWGICRDVLSSTPDTPGKRLSDFEPVEWGHIRDICRSDADCKACPGCPVTTFFRCDTSTANEFSVSVNHDQLRNGQPNQAAPNMCPAVRFGRVMVLNARWNPNALPATDPDRPTDPPPGLDCGDGAVNAAHGEQCDLGAANGDGSSSVPGVDCSTFKLVPAAPGGHIRCNKNCSFNKEQCRADAPPISGEKERCDAVAGPPPGREACVFDPLKGPLPAAGTSCKSLGFVGGDVGCGFNTCSLDAGGCSGQARPFKFGTFEEATESSVAQGTVVAIDSLGVLAQVNGVSGGQSHHEVSLFARRFDGDLWEMWALGRGEEYQGGTKDKPHLLHKFLVRFSGEDVVQVDNGPMGSDKGTLLIGGADTGPFVAGPAGQAPALSLEVRFGSVKRRAWKSPTGGLPSTSLFLVGTDVLAGEPGTAAAQQVGACKDSTVCQWGWNNQTGRFETTDHTIRQVRAQDPGNSRPGSVNVVGDWEIMKAALNGRMNIDLPVLFPTVPVPADCGPPLQIVAPPAGTTPVTKVVLVIDRSGSMITPVDARGTFQSGGGETRLEFAKAGARSFASLWANSGVQVGLVSFQETPTLDQQLIKIVGNGAGADEISLEDFNAKIKTLTPNGATGIGTALKLAGAQMPDHNGAGRSIVLLSDGENNRPTNGTDQPLDVARQLTADGITVYTVPTGQTADRSLMSSIAGATSGVMLDAPTGDNLPALYVEAYASVRGEALAMKTEPLSVAGSTACAPIIDVTLFGCLPSEVQVTTPFGTGTSGRDLGGCRCLKPDQPGDAPLPAFETRTFKVENGAPKLNVLFSTRNVKIVDWNPLFQLRRPDGTVAIDDEDPRVIRDPFFRLMAIENPMAGEWHLDIMARDSKRQFSYAVAHIQNPKPDCFAQVSPTLSGAGRAVQVQAQAGYFLPLGAGATFSGTVTRPDGSFVPLSFTSPNSPYPDLAQIAPSDLPFKGLYEVVVKCAVSADARTHSGETLLGSDGQPSVATPEAFEREVRTAFFVDSGATPPLPGPGAGGGDCDHNGIPDAQEGLADTDRDGLPDVCDEDDDGDDIIDVLDPRPRDPLCTGSAGACPTANAGPDQILECQASASAEATLDGQASSDPGNAPLMFSWNAPVALQNADKAVAFGSFPLGTTTAVLAVSNGTTAASDSAAVTVLDTTPPLLTAPPALTIASCKAPNIGTAVGTDGCGGPVTIVNDAPPVFVLGTTIVTWRAIDQFGNVAVKTQTVTVELGDDPVCCPPGTKVIVGTANGDVLKGTPGRDCILGLGGDDLITGLGGDDIISGGAGNDNIDAGDGNDLVFGGLGQNVVFGGKGNDRIVGGPGNENLSGGAGDDRIEGNGGDDVCQGDSGNDTVFGGPGNDVVVGASGNDQLFGDEGDDTLQGGDGDDQLNGGGGSDKCSGGAGRNTLTSCERN